jgi:hypothetical protein
VLGGPDHVHVESGVTQSLLDVGCVEADVVGLPERAQPRFPGDDRRIFVRPLAPEVERDHHEAPATAPGDPPQLAHRGAVIADVLEHVRADHRVEGRIGQIDLRQVEP